MAKTVIATLEAVKSDDTGEISIVIKCPSFPDGITIPVSTAMAVSNKSFRKALVEYATTLLKGGKKDKGEPKAG